jgi:hypothetical protein
MQRNTGVLEYWGRTITPPLRYSITPVTRRHLKCQRSPRGVVDICQGDEE